MSRIYDVITIGETTMDAFMTIHDSSEKVNLDKSSGELQFKHGEKINVERYDFSIGGNATNVAVGLSRLGLNAALCSETGDDEFSIKIRNTLASEGIERVLVKQAQGQSSFAVIINFKGDRTVFVQDVEREHDFNFEGVSAKYIYLTSLGLEWEGAYKKALSFAHSESSKIVFNPGHLQMKNGKDTVHKVLSNTYLLFVNKEEAEVLLFNHYNKKVDNSEHYIKQLCLELKQLGPKIVVITNGKNGSFALNESEDFINQDLFPGELVERTGAGDAYASGFLSALVHEEEVGKAMKWGSANAASVVGQIGAETGLLTKTQMQEKIK